VRHHPCFGRVARAKLNYCCFLVNPLLHAPLPESHVPLLHADPVASQGSAFYLGGCVLVVVGWTVIGLCLEIYGFWLLFCEWHLPSARL
jgi:hypothetical protein